MIKIYEIDYDFILKNYTDQKLWDKEWTIFVFKNYVFKISLERIYTKSKKIIFNLRLSSDLDIWCNVASSEIEYSIENMSIDFLKTMIKLKMFNLVEKLEENYIEEADETYIETYRSRDEEREQLEAIAENFLDSEHVYNDEIREAYIDKFVDDNEKIWEYLIQIRNEKKYTYLTDLWLVLAEISEDIELKQEIRNNNEKNLTELEAEIHNFIENLESEDYTKEMESNLEAI